MRSYGGQAIPTIASVVASPPTYGHVGLAEVDIADLLLRVIEPIVIIAEQLARM